MDVVQPRQELGDPELCLTVDRFLVPELHCLLQSQVLNCIERAGGQKRLEDAETWVHEAGIWNDIRLQAEEYMKDMGDWVED